MKNFIIGALIIGAIIGGAVIFSIGKIDNLNLSSSAGDNHTNLQYFQAGFVDGGDIVNKASDSSTTITAADVCKYGTITITPKKPSASTTFPTAASLTSDCLQRNGDSRTVTFWNLGLAASTTAFATNTGDYLFIPEVTGSNMVVAGQNLATFKFFRASSSAVYIYLVEQGRQQ